jgi:hypothetical protein
MSDPPGLWLIGEANAALIPQREQRDAEADAKSIDQKFRLGTVNNRAVRLRVCAGLRFEQLLRHRQEMPDWLPTGWRLDQAAECVRTLPEADDHRREIRAGNSKVGLLRDGSMYRCDFLRPAEDREQMTPWCLFFIRSRFYNEPIHRDGHVSVRGFGRNGRLNVFKPAQT